VSVLPPPPDLPLPPGTVPPPIADDGPPKASWRWWEILLVCIVGFFLAALPVSLIFRAFDRDPLTDSSRLDGVNSLANIVFQLVVLAVLLGYLAVRHRGWQRAVRLPRLRTLPREIAIGMACGIGMTFALGAVVAFVLGPLFRAVTGEAVSPAEQVASGIDGWAAVAFVVAAVIVAPVGEEFFHRGLFFRALRDRYGFWVGALASGLLFGALHGGDGTVAENLMLQIAIGLFGVVLAAIYEWRGSLAANIATHATFNLVTVLFALKVL
jgi:membrane protease YdiL (CAAX protease family)